MNDRITVHVKMKPYLRAFLIAIYGKEPVFFPKKDRLNDMLQLLLTKPPKNHIPPSDHSGTIEIVLPYFENLNIHYNHYLSERSQQTFEERVNKRFWVVYEEFLDECLLKGMTRNSAIALFIEKYNLPYNSRIEDRLRKAIYRSIRIQTKYPKRNYKFKSKKNTSDKHRK